MKQLLSISFRAAGCLLLMLFAASVYGTTTENLALRNAEGVISSQMPHEMCVASANSFFLDTISARTSAAPAYQVRRLPAPAFSFGVGSLESTSVDCSDLQHPHYTSTTKRSSWVHPAIDYHIYALHRIRI